MSILSVENLSIRYITGDFKDIGLKEWVLRHIQNNYHIEEFWANQDITFSLEEGDMLGIVGSNGAGKSTLLKAVSGILWPTKGVIHRRGTIAALLELASGFDGDLTVRENTFLRGAMLGYSKAFMTEAYPEIIAFAELEEFEDQPFSHLSSGMKSRLGFSIAALVRPDILILDEVLSVGDGAFRKKSEEKMKEIIADGTTTLFVSHSIGEVREMCNKVLWLDHGKQVAFGDVIPVCNAYYNYLMTPKKERVLPKDMDEIMSISDGMIRTARAERLREIMEEKKALEEEEAQDRGSAAAGQSGPAAGQSGPAQPPEEKTGK